VDSSSSDAGVLCAAPASEKKLGAWAARPGVVHPGTDAIPSALCTPPRGDVCGLSDVCDRGGLRGRRTIAMAPVTIRSSRMAGRPCAGERRSFCARQPTMVPRAGEMPPVRRSRSPRLMAALVDGFCEKLNRARAVPADHASTSTIPATRCTAHQQLSLFKRPLRRAAAFCRSTSMEAASGQGPVAMILARRGKDAVPARRSRTVLKHVHQNACACNWPKVHILVAWRQPLRPATRAMEWCEGNPRPSTYVLASPGKTMFLDASDGARRRPTRSPCNARPILGQRQSCAASKAFRLTGAAKKLENKERRFVARIEANAEGGWMCRYGCRHPLAQGRRQASLRETL